MDKRRVLVQTAALAAELASRADSEFESHAIELRSKDFELPAFKMKKSRQPEPWQRAKKGRS